MESSEQMLHLNGEDESYDELYDEPDNECEEKNGNRLVIFHLASQLTRNMDITRLSLPANLCERRSILETYSDYFSRTDLWLDICNDNSPQQRLCACLKWYLSTFNASRKSKLARKPYNPILGEVFKCTFKVNVKGKDVIVSYIGEQVSHHPPILVFHVEDECHKMSLTCQIHLRSKFLGFSVSIEMLGGARLRLLDRGDEEYIITFPTAYCNSIYTTPWLELGGKSTITCSQTGYSGKINFKRQSYFLGTKDRVEASLFKGNEKESFMVIKGNWNGIFMSKSRPDEKENVFLDITKCPLTKAVVQPRSQQSDFESRKVWESVTHYLKEKDLTNAVNAKIRIEEEQRNFQSERMKVGREWEYRYFKKIGDHYEFQTDN